MKIKVDNEKREIYIDGKKSTVTWGLLEDERRKTEYGINIMAEAMQKIGRHLITEFRLNEIEQLQLRWLLILKVKFKWDCDV